METVKIGDHVIITCDENRFCGKGALVVSEPLKCGEGKFSIQVVSVKVFSRDYSFFEGGWEEIFMILNVSDLKPDTKRSFDESRLEVKFGSFWIVYFLINPLNPNSECGFCNNSARVRIEMNIWGSIYQYDVCHTCAKKWDGVRADGPPVKKAKELPANATPAVA